MSVLIKDMEKPKSCYAVIDGESEYCPFVNTDDDCVLQLKKGICEGTWEEQYSKCPLIEEPEPCEDAVSWADVIDLYKRGAEIIAKVKGTSVEELPHNGLNALMNLPPVTPKRKTGKWIMEYKGAAVTSYKCSECGRTVKDDTGYSVSKDYPFCHCGAEMTEDSE